MSSRREIIKYIIEYYNKNKKTPIVQEESHPFTYSRVKKIFGGWNNALIESRVPLNRNEAIYTNCKQCSKPISKQYKEVLKTINDFCSHKCSAVFNNTGRKHSEETKIKIRMKLQKIRTTKCVMCDVEFRYYKRKNLTCGSKCLSELKKKNNLKKNGTIIENY